MLEKLTEQYEQIISQEDSLYHSIHTCTHIEGMMLD